MLLMAAQMVQGIAVGAFLVTALSVGRSALSRDARLTTGLVCLSAAAWTLTGSEQTSAALGRPYPLLLLAFPAAGLFWAFVACVFQDRPLGRLAFAPAGLLLFIGIAVTLAPSRLNAGLLAVFNTVATVVCLHAMVLIARSWRDDLVDARRASRVVILGLAALLAAVQGAAGAIHGLGGGGAWAAAVVAGDLGSVVIAALALAMGGLLLQARGPAFFTPPAPTDVPNPKLAATDRLLLAKLDAVMAAGAWSREGLSIGVLARELGVQEHRLRRLINARLGHRNFADFLNGYRIAAAKARLADPVEAETSIASLAFDLGFGSLNPFNRAFRASTGSTPTAWRRAALEAGVPQTVD